MEQIKKDGENVPYVISDDYRIAHNVKDTAAFVDVVNIIDDLFQAQATDGIRRQCEYTSDASDVRLTSSLTFFDGDTSFSEPTEEQLVIWHQSYKPPFTHNGGYNIRFSVLPSFVSQKIITNYYIEVLANGTYFGTMSSLVGDPHIAGGNIETVHEPVNMTMYDLEQLKKIIAIHLAATEKDNTEM